MSVADRDSREACASAAAPRLPSVAPSAVARATACVEQRIVVGCSAGSARPPTQPPTPCAARRRPSGCGAPRPAPGPRVRSHQPERWVRSDRWAERGNPTAAVRALGGGGGTCWCVGGGSALLTPPNVAPPHPRRPLQRHTHPPGACKPTFSQAGMAPRRWGAAALLVLLLGAASPARAAFGTGDAYDVDLDEIRPKHDSPYGLDTYWVVPKNPKAVVFFAHGAQLACLLQRGRGCGVGGRGRGELAYAVTVCVWGGWLACQQQQHQQRVVALGRRATSARLKPPPATTPAPPLRLRAPRHRLVPPQRRLQRVLGPARGAEPHQAGARAQLCSDLHVVLRPRHGLLQLGHRLGCATGGAGWSGRGGERVERRQQLAATAHTGTAHRSNPKS